MTAPKHYTGRPDSLGAANNERFNRLLNSCQNPRAMCAALLALAQDGTLGKLRKEAQA